MTNQIRHDGLLHTLCGTPAYVAPEILSKKGYDGAKVDVWSCGVILYVLNAGYLPFNDPNLMAMYKKIYMGEYRCPKWMSPDLKRFISRLLDTNPKTRITIDEILKDPWFRKGGYKEMEEKDFFCIEDSEYDKSDDDSKDITNLNAFDIISFSSGLDLTGLFNDSYNYVEDSNRFVSSEEPGKIVEKVEEFAKVEKLTVKKKKEWGLEVYGQNGNLVTVIEVYRLTESLVVVEAKRKDGEVGMYKEMWKNKLKPLLSGLTGQEAGSTSNQVSDS